MPVLKSELPWWVVSDINWRSIRAGWYTLDDLNRRIRINNYRDYQEVGDVY